MTNNQADSDQFQYWLMQMDEDIDEFLAQLPPKVRTRLDSSAGSLDILEAWLLEKYPSPEAARPRTEARVLDGAARYVGEILRKSTGSKWSINFEKSFVFRGLPILVGGSAFKEMPECPLSLITASLDRRTGTYLSRIVSKAQAAS
jgi:hypothetical protein